MSRTTDITLTPADPIGTSSASISWASALTNSGGRLRETAIRGRGAVLGGTTDGCAGVEGLAQRRLGDGTGDQVAVLPQGDVHGPVVARRLGELAGAVERVDDPDPAGVQPDLVVLALLGEDGVVRPVLGEQGHQQLVGGLVAGVLELAALEALLRAPRAGAPPRPWPARWRARGRRWRRRRAAFRVRRSRRHPSEGHAQELNRCWVRSSPSVTRDSTASAALSTWNGRIFFSDEE